MTAERRPCLYLSFDCVRPLTPPLRVGLRGIDEVLVGRGDTRVVERGQEKGKKRVGLHLDDAFLSSKHARILHIENRWYLEDLGSRNGCAVNGATTKRHVLSGGDVVEMGRSFFVFRDAVTCEPADPIDLDARDAPAPVTGMASMIPSLARGLAALAAAAPAAAPVMIFGAQGTGKELLALGAHVLSGRGGSFVALHCAELPAAQIEAEFARATGGTLFLDEVSELPDTLQVKLEKLLNTGKLGAGLVAAVHRDPQRLVEAATLRPDLYWRLSTHRLDLPPLRRRREDLGLIIAALLRRVAPGRAAKTAFDPRAARALFFHAWPRNVRELEECLASAVVLAGSGPIAVEHLPTEVGHALRGSPAAEKDETTTLDERPPLTPEDVARKEQLLTQIREHHGNVSAVARTLGRSPDQIRRWLRRYGVDASRFRD